MEYLKSELPRKVYLGELKGSLMSPFSFFQERVTGFVLGPFFAVAHHSDYEWDRRYNMVCSRAWGYVKEIEGESEIRFIRWYGYFTPVWLLVITLLWVVVISGVFLTNADVILVIPILGMSVFLSILICGITALGSILTDRGEISQGEITRLLQHPEDYYC